MSRIAFYFIIRTILARLSLMSVSPRVWILHYVVLYLKILLTELTAVLRRIEIRVCDNHTHITDAADGDLVVM